MTTAWSGWPIGSASPAAIFGVSSCSISARRRSTSRSRVVCTSRKNCSTKRPSRSIRSRTRRASGASAASTARSAAPTNERRRSCGDWHDATSLPIRVAIGSTSRTGLRTTGTRRSHSSARVPHPASSPSSDHTTGAASRSKGRPASSASPIWSPAPRSCWTFAFPMLGPCCSSWSASGACSISVPIPR